MSTAIEFENISKQYRLGLVSTRTLSHDLNRWWTMNVRGKEDPYLRIGETNDRSSKGSSDYVWALKDIDFKVEQGDVVGIIGRNGAGKSTLLKLLSRVTAPTTGQIRARGRIGSLLEVGTGFHPEMTGRENIYMNGAILGMTRAEVSRKLDEIVDFSGCERYLDTPVKRYSSGMMVRLGFAVAAHLDPEILVVDEVLAVGDAEFQKKAIGKMKDVSQSEGRTVLFVSHNMAAVRSLCKNGIVLKQGMIDYAGTSDGCVDYYLSANQPALKNHFIVEDDSNRRFVTTREIEYREIKMLNDVNNVSTEEALEFEFTIQRNKSSLSKVQFGIIVNNSQEMRVGACYTEEINLPTEGDTFKYYVKFLNHQLAKGTYSLDFTLVIFDYTASFLNYDGIFNAIGFEVTYLDSCHSVVFTNWANHQGSCAYLGAEVTLING